MLRCENSAIIAFIERKRKVVHFGGFIKWGAVYSKQNLFVHHMCERLTKCRSGMAWKKGDRLGLFHTKEAWPIIKKNLIRYEGCVYKYLSAVWCSVLLILFFFFKEREKALVYTINKKEKKVFLCITLKSYNDYHFNFSHQDKTKCSKICFYFIKKGK